VLSKLLLLSTAGLIVRPLPMGGVCMLSTTVMMWSGLLTSDQALSAFTDKTVWLIVGALLMAQAVDKSGLGLRISMMFIAAVGETALGLTYALMGADLLIAMAMPSTTAREGEWL
jgi:DASS family divalent anion:Na+ symporter